MEKNKCAHWVEVRGIWSRNADMSCDMEMSSPAFNVKFGVDGENKVCVHVSPHGGGDHHVLSRLQVEKLSQLPLTIVYLTVLHSPVVFEENTL